MPAASAPKIAEVSPMLHAGLGCPRNVTKAKSLVNNQEIIDQMGYPGGWGTPR